MRQVPHSHGRRPQTVRRTPRRASLTALRASLACAAAVALLAPAASANTSHIGWPKITGMHLTNKLDQARPLDGRAGADPFDGTDPTYSCDGVHLNSTCLVSGVAFAPADLVCNLLALAIVPGWPQYLVRRICTSQRTATVPLDKGPNELLGGHGNDVIHAGPAGDVLWGDYKPTGQPTTQVDVLDGGPGKDFMYASHGTNTIVTGGGSPLIYLSHKSRKLYRLHGCHKISYKTLGY